MKKLMKKTITETLLLALMICIPSGVLCENKSTPNIETSERKWIKKRLMSSKEIKVYIDGQPAFRLHPNRWKRDSSGNIYIREHELREWIERREKRRE